MCNVRCCGVFWSVVLALTIITAFALPFYWNGFYYSASGDPNEGCVVAQLVSWQDVWCATSNCTATMQNTLCPQSVVDWRENCGRLVGPASGDGCAEMRKLFDTTVGLLSISFICTCLLMLGFIMRCCGCGGKDRHTLHAVIGVLGAIFLLSSVAYFAARSPKAWTAAQGNCDTGPCASFFGSTNVNGHTAAWGPGGWVAAAVALFIYLFVTCCACSRTIEPVDQNQATPYVPLQGNQVAFVYGQAPAQPHTA